MGRITNTSLTVEICNVQASCNYYNESLFSSCSGVLRLGLHVIDRWHCFRNIIAGESECRYSQKQIAVASIQCNHCQNHYCSTTKNAFFLLRLINQTQKWIPLPMRPRTRRPFIDRRMDPRREWRETRHYRHYLRGTSTCRCGQQLGKEP
jgi:hypothetical protein